MTSIETNTDELLQARYGQDTPPIPTPINAVIGRLLAHKSVRSYRPDALPLGALEQIVAAAQSAATSSNLQTWSVVAIQDPEHKRQVSILCGDQDFIRQAPLFLVFCADLARLTHISEQVGLPGEGLDYIEMFIMATIDVALAAQNAAIAAESLGLGICYVGAARNRPRELAELLHLPSRTIALFGMAVGRPAEQDTSAVKPRLSQPVVLHHETYSSTDQDERIAHYDAAISAFYHSQRMNVTDGWTRHSAKRVATVGSLTGRHILHEVLQERGFGLK